ncbi:MAG: bacteriophage holin [Candidatus Komeilibacteria bacterium]|nr:bacteriophage holin [Candidatus Komeilibacteria bacterium]
MLNANNMGLAAGIVWGVGAFLLGLAATYLDWGVMLVDALGSLYIGYAATLGGAFLGLIWGFVDAYVAGLVMIWLYNKFSVK